MKDKPGIRFGLIAGLTTLVYLVVFYLINKQWMVGPVVFFGTLAIYFPFMYLAARRLDAEATSMRDALRHAFLVFLIANAFFYTFYFLIHTFDSSLEAYQREAMRAWLPRITPKDQLERQLRALESADFSVSLKTVFFGYARGAIMGFLFALLLAWLARRNAGQNV